MTVQLRDANLLLRMVDQNGRLTLEGLQILERMVEALRDHEARLEALEP